MKNHGSCTAGDDLLGSPMEIELEKGETAPTNKHTYIHIQTKCQVDKILWTEEMTWSNNLKVFSGFYEKQNFPSMCTKNFRLSCMTGMSHEWLMGSGEKSNTQPDQSCNFSTLLLSNRQLHLNLGPSVQPRNEHLMFLIGYYSQEEYIAL